MEALLSLGIRLIIMKSWKGLFISFFFFLFSFFFFLFSFFFFLFLFFQTNNLTQINRVGEQKAKQFYQETVSALHLLRKRIDNYAIECDVNVCYLLFFFFHFVPSFFSFPFFPSSLLNFPHNRTEEMSNYHAFQAQKKNTKNHWSILTKKWAPTFNFGMVWSPFPLPLFPFSPFSPFPPFPPFIFNSFPPFSSFSLLQLNKQEKL